MRDGQELHSGKWQLQGQPGFVIEETALFMTSKMC